MVSFAWMFSFAGFLASFMSCFRVCCVFSSQETQIGTPLTSTIVAAPHFMHLAIMETLSKTRGPFLSFPLLSVGDSTVPEVHPNTDNLTPQAHSLEHSDA